MVDGICDCGHPAEACDRCERVPFELVYAGLRPAIVEVEIVADFEPQAEQPRLGREGW